jgi:hypothetical protein
MFALAKQVLFKYTSFVMKMVKDILGKALIANTNYEMFFDPDIVLKYTCVLPMLEVVETLLKLAQGKVTYVYDFMVAIKLNVGDLYNMYANPIKMYDDLKFQTSNNLVDHTCDVLFMVLRLQLET